jgi:putative transposase
MWVKILKTYDDKKGIKWNWQSPDGTSIKSPLGRAMTGSNPTDRGKLGTKTDILTDKNGIPISVVITSASTHDTKAVTGVIYDAVITRSTSTTSTTKNKITIQHLCLDKSCNSGMAKQETIKRGYVSHMPYKRKGGEVIRA